MAKVLVVYYSRSGTTRRLAQAIARIGGWDVEEVIDARDRSGLLGYFRSALDASLSRLTTLQPERLDPREYDLVVIGTPVWNASVSSPVRTYLHRHSGALRNLAFFVTCGGRGGERVFRQMSELAGRNPMAELTVTARDQSRGRVEGRAQHFVEEIKAELARRAPPPPQPTAPAP